MNVRGDLNGHVTTPVINKSTKVYTDLYYVPDTVRPIYFLSDRGDSQAEFSLLPNMAETSVNAFL